MPESVTFVVVADDAVASQLYSAARDFLDAGLVRPFLVVRAEDVLDTEDPVATWIGSMDSVRCDSILATAPYSTVRVVGFQAISAATGGSERVTQAMGALARSFEPRLATSQRSVRLNVLAPDDRIGDLPADLLSLYGSANVVVAPEDRESPDHASHPLDDADRLRTHALVSLLGIAGLWVPQVRGPFDGHRDAAFNEIPHVYVTRAFGRIARAPQLVEHVSQAVFRDRGTASWAAEAVGGVPAPDPHGITAAQTGSLLERHGRSFSFSQPPPAKQPEQQRVGVGRAFVLMFRYVRKGLAGLPLELASHASDVARRAVADFAQNATYGPGSRVVVHGSSAGDGDPPDLTAGAADMATALLTRAGGAVPTPPAAGDAWQDLRGVAFALVDGSVLPSGYAAPSDGVVLQIITDPDAIAPDPQLGGFDVDPSVAQQLPTSARATVRPSDAAQARHLLQHLDDVESGTPGRTADPVDESASEDIDEQEMPDAADAASAEAHRLREWVAGRDQSMTWRLSEHLATHLDAAHDTFSRALARVSQGAAGDDGLLAQKARKRLHRSWWLWLLAVLVAGGLVGYLRIDAGAALTVVQLAVAGGVMVLALLVGWLIAFVVFLRRMFRIQHRLDRQNAEYLAAVRAATHSAEAMVRLSSMNRQMRDWSEIIGWMVHHPEGRLDLPEEAGVPAHELPVPASHRIGVAQWDGRTLPRLAAVVGRDLFGSGWLTGLFGRYRDVGMAKLKYDLGRSEAAPNPDPDHDNQPDGPRAHLLRVLASREPAEEWTRDSVVQIAERLGTVSSEELFDVVREADGEEAEARSFLFSIFRDAAPDSGGPSTLAPMLWTNAARMAGRDAIAKTYGWSTTPLPERVEELVRLQPATSGRVSTDSVHDVAVLRMDATEAVPFTDLRLFRGGGPSDSLPAEEPPSGSGDIW